MEHNYYILKPGIVNKSNELKYTGLMQIVAEEKIIFIIDKTHQCLHENMVVITDINHFASTFTVLKEWIIPAPLELVIAARLKGEI